ncbi:MAG: lysophospholipid acyltransferase family protein, partial [Terriglobia bacterium]
MLWSLTYWLLKPVFLVLYRLQVAGRDNIPRAGPVIIAANHSSYLDPVVIGLAYRHRIRFMAKDELFRKPGVGWIMRLFRAFPVKRGARDLGAVKRALRILGQGGHVCVFPQGTRR